jgi:hypothetical protein
MQFKPKTEQELKDELALNLLPKGDYDFEVLDATDTLSKAGNEMIKLKLRVYDKQGKGVIVFDYLLESMAYKFKHFCDTVGLSSQYEAGKVIGEECIGKAGVLEIIIQEDKTGQYGPRNSVKDYVVSVSKHANGQPLAKSDFVDSELPF